MRKILVYDDDQKFKTRLKESIESVPAASEQFKIVSMPDQDLEQCLNVLQDRQIAFRERGEWGAESVSLDDASVFVIDYDLVGTRGFLTGEAIAYLARCFSTCGLIVDVNQFRDMDFDLTLKGHPESFADLNVTDEHLGNPNLWDGDRQDFWPWYWPVLPDHLCSFAMKVEHVKTSLAEDRPIWQLLGFPEGMFDVLHRSIAEFLGPEPSTTTFRQLVTESGNGLRLKDAGQVNDDVIARVGAARVSKWLERTVLSEQDILVDAPHLVSRYPSLLAGDRDDLEAWNRTAKRTDYRGLGLKVDQIEDCRLKHSHWLSRPAWFWDKLRENEQILEVSEPWETEIPEWVFCEDVSRFLDSGYRQFLADVRSPYSRRFVRDGDLKGYRPRVRLAL